MPTPMAPRGLESRRSAISYRRWRRHSPQAECTWSPSRSTIPRISECWSTNSASGSPTEDLELACRLRTKGLASQSAAVFSPGGRFMSYTIEVNGSKHSVDAEGDTPLLWVLRDILDMTGTKYGCGVGQCGACTVHANGAAVRSCLLPLERVGDLRITTIEGVGATDIGRKVQEKWLALDVPQCGYCQGGQIMSAAALLVHTARPGDAEIDAAMAGNLCRCGCYPRIRAAIKHLGDSRTA